MDVSRGAGVYPSIDWAGSQSIKGLTQPDIHAVSTGNSAHTPVIHLTGSPLKPVSLFSIQRIPIKSSWEGQKFKCTMPHVLWLFDIALFEFFPKHNQTQSLLWNILRTSRLFKCFPVCTATWRRILTSCSTGWPRPGLTFKSTEYWVTNM